MPLDVRLNAGVPDEIQSHFEIVRNLAIYAWFVCSFNAVAEMQAFVSLEMAVREKTGDPAVSTSLRSFERTAQEKKYLNFRPTTNSSKSNCYAI